MSEICRQPQIIATMKFLENMEKDVTKAQEENKQEFYGIGGHRSFFYPDNI